MGFFRGVQRAALQCPVEPAKAKTKKVWYETGGNPDLVRKKFPFPAGP
jgi:hypothetical protein